MKHRILFLLLALVAWVIVSCEREAPVSPPESNEAQELQGDSEAITDFEELAKKPDRGLSDLLGRRKVVVLSAGSVDGLAAAIEEAGPRGAVLVRSGEHTESGTVTITQPVAILGEPGASFVFDTQPLPPAATVEPDLHVLGTSHVIVFGLEFRPAQELGGTAILVENSPHVKIASNTFLDHQFAVMLEQGDDAIIFGNTIIATTAWQVEFFEVHGIVVINGDRVQISHNDVSNAFFGVWACDEDGTFTRNHVHENYIGLILCDVPPGSFPLPGGNLAGSENPGTNWQVRWNNATGNFDAGYLVIDGANHNKLVNNDASGNGTYDIELTGDTERFGFLSPRSHDNKVNAGEFNNIIIKDCGENNTVIGGVQVDITQDPCF